MVQLSCPYMTTGKTIALTRWTFVGKEVCLLFNMLSRLVINFLPRIQFSSVAQSCPTLWDPMNRSTPGLPVHHQHQSSLRLMSIKSVMPSSHLILCQPLLLLPSIFPRIRILSSEPALCIRWSKYWNFSFAISPSNEYSGLISFRIDWFDLLAVKELSKVFSNTSLKASVLQCSAFFLVQLSHSYITTGKAIVLTIWTLVAN